ncbi:molybdopterin-containing oxidoreductase family protein [Halarcobacter anaerophilus]|uniref:Thiosulfate reductase n=1 Tax=Halarcobacter anaerophilus TaxID=877500 RepID=A0A4Q0Y3Q4_9BACT|nr:molybdopterin-dependent oxidoreductase [Halarcobacter anaerophilus]QDF27803.1 putative thiosulfate/polysulfide reductase, molybdenum-binding subunit [Halarcobacter anaerophilus]RXJ64145.1 thiosulfate reductase [Halarcobacter anaerophilus]
MEVEISRRKFLQGTVALSVVAASTSALSSTKSYNDKKVFGTTKISSNKEDIRIVPTLCEMCVNKCAAYARVENNVVTKLDPNPHFPKSQNMLCARGNAGIQALYDPDRIKYPLIRVGERGDGKYKRVTWDEAYTYITKKLTKILDEEEDNRSCIGYCAGEGMAEHTFKSFMFDKIGSSNFVNHASICLQTAVSGYALTIGKYGQADLQNARYVIMAGANRAEAIVTPDTMDIFKRTRGKGASLVVVDPRFTNTAIHADRYLAIKPGTDLAFVLAMTYHVIKYELYNRTYVKNNFSNFDKYKEHVLSSNYTPEWAEKITGISAKQIKAVAEEFMENAPQSIYYQGRRSTWSKNDFQLRRAQAIFTALGGGIDVKGGIVFGKKLPLGTHKVNAPMYANAESRIEKDVAAIVGASGSWIGWRNKILENKTPYPVRAFFAYKQNPMLSVPTTSKTKKMLEKMDLVVVIDTIPSDTAMMADVILPECTYLEREDPVKSFPGIEPSIALRKKAVEPMYETKPVLEIVRGLAKKLSKPLWEITKKYDEDVQDELDGMSEEEIEEYYQENGFNLADAYEQSQEEVNKHMVESVYGEEAWKILREKGVFYPNFLKDFKKIDNNSFQYYDEKEKFYTVVKLEDSHDSDDIDTCINPRDIAEIKRLFPTPSKKIECYLDNLEKKGVEPMPAWHDEDYKKVPKGKFKFISGRHAQFTQNATQNNVMLLELMPENYVWINKKNAKEHGIEHGDLVEVKSSVGTVQIKAFPTDKIVEDTLFYIHGFGSKSTGMTFAQRNGASDNEIIEDDIEPVFGSAIMHETIVSIRKV